MRKFHEAGEEKVKLRNREMAKNIDRGYSLSEPRAKEGRTTDILSLYKRYTIDIQTVLKK